MPPTHQPTLGRPASIVSFPGVFPPWHSSEMEKVSDPTRANACYILQLHSSRLSSWKRSARESEVH